MKKNLFALLGALIMTTSAWAFSHEAIGVHSAAMNKDVMVSVITPDSYNPKSAEPYNVLYLLHGHSGDNTGWLRMGNIGPAADQYNLIACAMGHHIYESRWLHNQDYLNQIIHTWSRGNEGGPMKKMMNFSSWNPDALMARYLVNGDKNFLLDMKDDLIQEYNSWEATHRLPNGLYWQGDVQDGMEESISGGRKKQYARPTINSYMYGNAKALTMLGLLSGDEAMAMTYGQKADTLKALVQGKLWNKHKIKVY